MSTYLVTAAQLLDGLTSHGIALTVTWMAAAMIAVVAVTLANLAALP